MSHVFCRRLIVAAVLGASLSMAVSAVRQVPSAYAACAANQQPCGNLCIDEKQLCILEPVPGGPSVVNPGGGALQIFFDYINSGLWQWAFKMGVAIAVLNGVAGGLQIVLSNGDSNKVDAGKTRFISSTLGLVMLLLSGVILEFLNPLGFKVV